MELFAAPIWGEWRPVYTSTKETLDKFVVSVLDTYVVWDNQGTVQFQTSVSLEFQHPEFL